MQYVVRNSGGRRLCRHCGRPVALFWFGWKHVGPWRNADAHAATPLRFVPPKPKAPVPSGTGSASP